MAKFEVKNIHVITSKGKKYYYDRITRQRIKSEPGTLDFIHEVLRIREDHKNNKKPAGDTLGYLFEAYKASPEYERLMPRTKKDYNRIMDYLRPCASVKIKSVDAPYISQIKEKAYKKHKRTFANYVVSFFSLVFNWGIEPGITTGNPTDGVKKIKRPKDAAIVNRKWKDYELKVWFQEAHETLQLAVAIGAYAGLREGDMCCLPLSAIKDNFIEFRQSKTGGEPLNIPIHKDLCPYLDNALARPNKKAMTVVVGHRGRSYTEDGFRAMFFREVKRLVDAGKVEPGLTFHGLRHTVGSYLAEAGAGDNIIQSILGHTSTEMAKKYRRDADKKSGAKVAIDILEGRKK